ncbi:DUF551 domain-containing protein [Atlantibacter hermannii]|uniref:DUF551 domain-containing protein n=1 Tax=Atlantibacter hermannii TaxID=565 RepID=UPI0028A622F0|nr:DUF551 domain-containing protein [Atlantibacter hermannii]
MTINERVSPKRLAEIIARAEVCDDSVLTDYRDIESIARELQQYRAATACPAVWVRYGDANHAPDCTLDNDEAREWVARGLDVVRMVSPINAAPQVTSVPEIAARLVDTYLLNEGTDSEFIACYTISKNDRISEKGKQIWADWRALSAALKSSQTAPAVQAEQLSGNTEQVEPVSDANKLGGWIPCSERMPAKGQEVLCTDQFENYETALYDTGYIPGPPFFATTAGEFHPTHWMPLPAPPFS